MQTKPTPSVVANQMIKNRNAILIAIALGVLLNPLNSSMIAIALDRLQHAFNLSFTSASWLISTYYLASAISQPVMGKLADVLGQKRVFLTGVIMVAISCTAAPFSPTFGWLIALRLIQSVGSGAMYPAGMGIVRKYITEGQAKAVAFLAIFSSGAAAFGPSIGGIAMYLGDWPAIFWINFPFILASILLGMWFLPKDKQLLPTERKGHFISPSLSELIRKLDLYGAFLFALCIIFSLLFLLSLIAKIEWWASILAVTSLIGFIIRETQASTPFVNLTMFKENPALSWVLIQFVTVNVIFYSIFFGIPTYLQEVRHFTAQETGFLMLCVAGFGLITSPIAGWWIEKYGSRPPLLLAGLCMTIGSALYFTVQDSSPVWWIAVILSVLGLSGGFNNVGLQTALFRLTPVQIISAASGLFQTARYIGTILSTVLLGLLFGNHLITTKLHDMGLVLTVLGFLVIWMSYRLPRQS